MSNSSKIYDFVVVGAGIAGSCTAYFLSKKTKNILIVDKNSTFTNGASGAAGAFLNPILGKPNDFKDLVTKALEFSVDFYSLNLSNLTNFSEFISTSGTLRVATDDEDFEKFCSYEEFIDFDYEKRDEGYFFPIGSMVNATKVCETLLENINQKYDYEVKTLQKKDDFWLINDEIKTKNIVLTTGANIKLIEEEYVNIRPVWGQKINVLTSTKTDFNYHKECSISVSTAYNDKYKLSIGATHNRFKDDMSDTLYNLDLKDINDTQPNQKTMDIVNSDTKKLIDLANDIIKLDDIEIIDFKIGARAASFDYFPIVGKLVDSKKTIENHPHILNGSHIKKDKLSMIDNLYIINGVGGRGYVLSPYLAKVLVESIFDGVELNENISSHRLFRRWAKRLKGKNR